MAEETTLRLQQVICPSCKRPINAFNPNKLMAECIYCHSKLVNPLVKPKDVPVPERIIPFTTNEQTFENALTNALINQDYVPTNIFEAISTRDVIQAYLPMYLFEGTYNASWSCESSYMDQKVDVGRNSVSTKEVKRWRPQNGNAAGNFAFLCLANEGDEIPDELRKFTHLFPYDVMMSKEYADGMIDFEDENLMTLERNADETLVWQKHGKSMVDETAKKAARNQIGNQEIRNFRASTSYNLTTTGKYVYAPFWFVYYNYAGGQFHFLMDGVGQRTEYSYPVNQEEVNFVNGKNKIKSYVSWLWPLALLLWYVFNITTALVYLAIWFVAKIVVKKIMDKKIQQQLDDSRAQRLAGANRL
ncbi:MAG: hypothetical protein J6I54_02535 [Bacteroidaceae bacterium]|nr:hypothetical protein [Bacteroidaceae bacterium]MBR1468137.1 hypothetical protein [Bacteroidaceae bacterium]